MGNTNGSFSSTNMTYGGKSDVDLISGSNFDLSQELFSISDLPKDMLRSVFVYLNGSNLASAARVCKEWNSLMKDDDLWRIKSLVYMDTLTPTEVDAIINNRVRTESSWKDVYKTLVSGKNFPYLIYGADIIEHLGDIQKSLRGIGFTNVTIICAGNKLLTLEDIEKYRAILVYSYSSFSSAAGVGNLLADYIDQGYGGVVTMCFANCGVSNQIRGRWAVDYEPIQIGNTKRSPEPLYGVFPKPHPLVLGVTNFHGGLKNSRGSGKVHEEASVIATWSDSDPLVVEMKKGPSKIVGLNFFPVSSVMYNGDCPSTTDAAKLMGNALSYAASKHIK